MHLIKPEYPIQRLCQKKLPIFKIVSQTLFFSKILILIFYFVFKMSINNVSNIFNSHVAIINVELPVTAYFTKTYIKIKHDTKEKW